MRRARAAVAATAALAASCGVAAPAEKPAIVAERTYALPGAVTATAPETCANGIDDNQNGLFDEGCGLRTSAVQFVAGWSAPRADVDLRVIDPNGELVEVGRVAASGLTKDRDCPGRNNDCGGRNVENVYLEAKQPLKGEYRVRVRLESLGGETPPVRVNLGTRLGAESRGYELTLSAPESEKELRLQY